MAKKTGTARLTQLKQSFRNLKGKLKVSIKSGNDALKSK